MKNETDTQNEKETRMIRIELLTQENFDENSLDEYKRTQNVQKVYRRNNGEYELVDMPYVEEWNLERKRQIARNISSDAYISYVALDHKVVGFIGLIKNLKDDYMILDMMHVSADCRGMGLGRKLFEIGKREAQKAGAKALYISACSSEETIAFYRAMGAKLTDHPIEEIAEDEPYDLQMVCTV
jgi:N-acetylglutamate synthase-like GNAT family acetyltransferase